MDRPTLLFHCFAIGVLASSAIDVRGASGADPLATPIAGDPFAARLTAVDNQRRIVFRTGEETKTLPADDLVAWGAPAELEARPLVALVDGSLIVATTEGADKQRLRARSPAFGSLSLPLEEVAGVLFHPPGTRKEVDAAVDRIVEGGKSDRLLLSNGDEISGVFERIEAGSVQLRTQSGPLTISTQRIAALILASLTSPRVPASPGRTWLGLADGGRLLVDSYRTDQAALHLARGQSAWKTAAEDLVWLQPLGSRVVYLSDLKPGQFRHVPFLSVAWPYRLDRNVSGGWLRAGKQVYLKGIGVHSAAVLTYELSEPFRRFAAEVAIDDETAGGGSVVFRVLVDGRAAYVSPIVRGGEAPQAVSVDIQGAKRLELLVDYADRGDQLDHADWLNARLER